MTCRLVRRGRLGKTASKISRLRVCIDCIQALVRKYEAHTVRTVIVSDVSVGFRASLHLGSTSTTVQDPESSVSERKPSTVETCFASSIVKFGLKRKCSSEVLC